MPGTDLGRVTHSFNASVVWFHLVMGPEDITVLRLRAKVNPPVHLATTCQEHSMGLAGGSSLFASAEPEDTGGLITEIKR